MKCISLWQPWATLVARGLKTVETRHWHTNHTGYLAIHAAKKPKTLDRLKEILNNLAHPGAKTVIAPMKLMEALKDETWPGGVVVAVVNMVKCVPTQTFVKEISFWEKAFGNYEPDRFAWVFGAITALEKPVPTVGRQGFWNLPDDVRDAVWKDVGPKCRTDWETVKV